MNALSNKHTLWTALALAFFMLLTRGSHVLTAVSLPDASVMLFLLGGLLLGRASWFAGLFLLATAIDFGVAAIDPAQGFCLTAGYWGMVPTYGVMWLGGLWLARRDQPFAWAPFSLVALASSTVAFILSTQSYYLFSARFPAQGLWVSLQHGWEYLPDWLLYTGFYTLLILLGKQTLDWLNNNVRPVRQQP